MAHPTSQVLFHEIKSNLFLALTVQQFIETFFLCNFCQGQYQLEAQHLGETILNLDQRFRNLALVAILYSGVEPLVQF